MFSTDGGEVTDGLPDGLTDESDDVWTERKFPTKWTSGKFHTAMLMGIFTINLADGWTDGTHDGHAGIWVDFKVESDLG